MSNTVIMEREATSDMHCRWTFAAVAAIATAMLVLAGCGSDDSAPTEPNERASSSTTSSLEGIWRTSSIAPRDAEATLRRQGLGTYVKDFRANAPFSTDTVLELSIEGGQWNFYGETEEGREPIDYDAEYKIDGDTVTFHHADGSNTHRWTVDGNMLSLEFVKTTLPQYEGIPNEVFQRALYMTAAFTKQD